MLAVIVALGSALLLAVASVLQHRAGAQPGNPTLRQILRRPVWLWGAVTGVAGFTLHVVALSVGSLSVVQPLLVTSLLFALPIGWIVGHRKISVSDLVAGAAVVLGLIVFQFAARESAGRSSANLALLAWSSGVVALVCTVALLIGARSQRHRAGWLGFCAGAAYGLLAALLKSAVGSLADGPTAMLTNWPVYAFAVVVVGAIVVNQLAFNAGPLASSLPLITIADPVVSVAVGVVAFGETVASQPLLVMGQLVGFATMTIGVVALTRREGAAPVTESAPIAVAA